MFIAHRTNMWWHISALAKPRICNAALSCSPQEKAPVKDEKEEGELSPEKEKAAEEETFAQAKRRVKIAEAKAAQVRRPAGY